MNVTGITIFSVLFMGSLVCDGQIDTINKESGNLPLIKVSYLSTLVYPGFSFGTELVFRSSDVSPKKLKQENKIITGDQLISCDLNFYHHPGFHNNLYLTTKWICRRTRHNGFFSEFSAGAGISRTFLTRPVYGFADDGTIILKKHAGYWYALITTGGGIGFDLFKSKKIPLTLYTTMNMICMFPYNNVVYFRPVAEIGSTFVINRHNSAKNDK